MGVLLLRRWERKKFLVFSRGKKEKIFPELKRGGASYWKKKKNNEVGTSMVQNKEKRGGGTVYFFLEGESSELKAREKTQAGREKGNE